ncbi:YcdB/YcdC domain-containing protein [Radiobacillus sp. PE A8.2]|uniref:YcdB/YcdC domain-containing protein n=1 Tax=Radiobacillus sp. PE A8.2 TaxID=3380349 RepID=UPI00388D277C
MKTMLQQLQPFLPATVYDRVSEYEEDTFDLVVVESDEEIGSYSVNAKGELMTFCMYEEAQPGEIQKAEIVTIADQFINTFYPEQPQEYELSAVIDLDNPYMVIYEKREEKYGLFLHSTGFTISVSTSGQVTYFTNSDEKFEVKYADALISKEEALQRYMDKLDFEIMIQQLDNEIYKNGDNQYHLVYGVLEHAFDIPVDGTEPASVQEKHESEPIPKQPVPTESIHQLVGLTAEYKLLDKQITEGKKIELWSTKDEVKNFSFDMDEQDNDIVKLCFDENTSRLVQIVSGEAIEENDAEIGEVKARQVAFQLLYKLFSDTDTRFQVEMLEDFLDDELEDEEVIDDEVEESESEEEIDFYEEDIESEPSYTFYFHLFCNKVRVDQHVSIMEVGRYSGKVNNFNLDVPSDALFKKFPSLPVLSKEDVKKIYEKHVEMELMFVREYDEDQKSIFSLSYVASFPDTVGHVRVIDAVSGKAYFVDVGDASFLL